MRRRRPRRRRSPRCTTCLRRGSYEIVNAESGLCADISGGSTAVGVEVIQWTCHGGTYSVASVRSGLLLTTASTTAGSLVTQQPDTGSSLQRWTMS
ncbi:RICIN domain-containing protein [Streptomyces sp. NBC_01244]|uniref:RICIN domain-containing protein n=1 Tax=Streptomyces sp. NBC_01244 TaxID=2903797 RepID=UPI002E0EABE0|nr:RICIN domain-containing protein [Streptomyces sp. NBC_01244]